MKEYIFNAFASADNKMFIEDISITVVADSLENAKNLAMNELVKKLNFKVMI